MAKCEYCGSIITRDMRVCESCGAPIPETAFASESNNTQSADYADYTDRAGYRLLLISCGSCTRSQAEDLLEDLLQYDTQESREIMDCLPAEAARNLTEEQAAYLAQALTEYGMEVAVYDRDGYVDLSARERGSLFDSDGNYIRRFAGILAALTAANRVIRPMRWGRPIDRRHLFMPDCPPPHPPVHRRRSRSLLERLFGGPEPARRRPEPVPPMRRGSERMPGAGGGRQDSMRSGVSSMGRGGAGGRSRSGGASSMGPGGAGGRSRSGGTSSMGRGGRPQGGSRGGSRGPSRGHGPR